MGNCTYENDGINPQPCSANFNTEQANRTDNLSYIPRSLDDDRIIKTVRKTPWLFDSVIKAEPTTFDAVSKDDPHPSDKGSEQLAQMFTAEVKRRGWL